MDFFNPLILQVEGTTVRQNSDTTNPAPYPHTLEDLNSPKHHCDNLKPRAVAVQPITDCLAIW